MQPPDGNAFKYLASLSSKLGHEDGDGSDGEVGIHVPHDRCPGYDSSAHFLGVSPFEETT